MSKSAAYKKNGENGFEVLVFVYSIKNLRIIGKSNMSIPGEVSDHVVVLVDVEEGGRV